MPKLPLIGPGLLLLAAYALAPGFALFRLDQAVRHDDVATVTHLVDWPAVRQGLADQVAGGVLGAQAPGGSLPPFGFSFVSHLADHAIAARLTPRKLIGLAHAAPSAGAPLARVRLAGAWFDGPRQLTVRLRLTGQHQPIRLRMQLQRGGWKLVQVQLPPDLLRRAAETRGSTDETGSARTADLVAPKR